MPKRTLAIISVAAGIFFSAAILKADTPPKIEESTPDADKAAVSAASSDADKWAATTKPPPAPKPPTPDASAPSNATNTKPAVQPPAAVPAPAPTPAPAPIAAPPKTSAPPVAHRSDLNEMKGKLESKSSDPQTLRLIVDGGFNVEFTYDNKTAMINGGSPITIDDLNYGDELIIRYSGKELYAVELDRVSKAPTPPE